MPIDLDRFCRDGFARVDGAITEGAVQAARRAVWRSLEAQGIAPDDRSTWTQPVVRVRCPDESLVAAPRATALADAYDALVGPGRWLPPGNAGDVVPVRFPSEERPVDVAWHVEGNWKGTTEYHTDLWSTGRGLFALLLLSNTGLDDAPMAMVPGSHRYVPSVLEPYGSDGLGGAAIVAALDPAVLCRRVEFATGEAGDVYLCHPFLVHTATWPHRGTHPRIAVVAKLEIFGGYALDGSDPSPIASTIAAGTTM
ncbi:MAG TPA: phytanoyl-CoA dioxygenase [Acidimicrobiia bacterium]|nr:phytanoyl-CoA dioxygenase [Acidimicrobiia bacterium]